MKNKKVSVGSLLLFFTLFIYAQPAIEWQKCFGGSGDEQAASIQQTNDGGYIVFGTSESSDGDVTINQGGADYWVIKIDSTGIIEWEQTFGGSGEDWGASIQQTSDGGYILAGHSQSIDGDVIGNHGNYDYWIVKLSNVGNVIWQHSLGGSYNDYASSVQQTMDGGYIVAGYSFSSDGDVTEHHGFGDYWIVKLSLNGDITWQQSFGGSWSEDANSIQQTSDSGYIVAGHSRSNDGDVTGNHGSYDYWLVKLANTGDILWQKSFGGTGGDIATSIQQTPDEGYIVAGYSGSTDGDVSGNHGGSDYWIVKLTNVGEIVWEKSLGGSSPDTAISIHQTIDDGYFVSGFSYSNDGDVTANHGGEDYWLIKLNSSGNLVWQKSLGGTSNDLAFSSQRTIDNSYIIAGVSYSNNGDVSSNHGGGDIWIVKLGSDVTGTNEMSESSVFRIFPNPASDYIILQTTGVVVSDFENAVFTIYDYTGKTVLSGKLSSENTQVELGTLSTGIYAIQIQSNEDLDIARFVKK